jgi:hypothetical protein
MMDAWAEDLDNQTHKTKKGQKKKKKKGTSLGHRYVSSSVIARNMGVVVVGV